LLTALVALPLLLAPTMAAARVLVGFGLGYPAYPYGYWGGGYGGYPYPYAAGPYGYPPPGPYGGYGDYGYGQRPMGKVKISTPLQDAEIYVDGSFAGRAKDLHHFYLRAGSHRIEQRQGTDVQKVHVSVMPYHTVKIEFGKLGTPSPAEPPAPPEAARPYRPYYPPPGGNYPPPGGGYPPSGGNYPPPDNYPPPPAGGYPPPAGNYPPPPAGQN
jgi:hypothetical protein